LIAKKKRKTKETGAESQRGNKQEHPNDDSFRTLSPIE